MGLMAIRPGRKIKYSQEDPYEDMRDPLNAKLDSLEANLAASQAEVARLRGLLLEFGGHEEFCPRLQKKDCTCGWSGHLEALAQEAGE